jgi:osmotically inducible lipoprotein OsmB
MFTLTKTFHAASCVILVALLSACAGMTEQEKSTAIGAGAGAIGGSILTGGSAAGTLGGAAVGGVLGHELKK